MCVKIIQGIGIGKGMVQGMLDQVEKHRMKQDYYVLTSLNIVGPMEHVLMEVQTVPGRLQVIKRLQLLTTKWGEAVQGATDGLS